MARIRLKGLNKVVRTLADGKKATYYYAWKGGPRLPGKPGSAEFMKAYHAAIATSKSKTAGTMETLIHAYMKSAEFKGLAQRTQEDYTKHINKISAKFSDFPLDGASDKRARGAFLKWRDELATTSMRQADYAWSVVNRIFSWGIQRGLVTDNPCARAGKLYRASRSEKVWTDDDEATFLRLAPEHLHLPLLLALWTGQRQGDLLRLTWGQYDGQTIRLQQQKTGVRVVIPVAEALRTALDPLRAAPSHRILQTSRGTDWTQAGFQHSWRIACQNAGIVGLTFHDLRGTAVTRLAIAGATEAEIATLTGHALNDVRAILDSHYLSRDPALAERAIEKLEAAAKIPKRIPKRGMRSSG